MLEIKLLGELEVVRDGGIVELPPSRRIRALFAFLVATGRAHTRERLCDLLWEGPSDPRAQLRWSLSKIREFLGEDAARLVADRSRVALDVDGVGIDLRIARQALGSGGQRLSTEILESLVGRFRGEFLEGLDLPDHHTYHAWCLAEREAAHRLHVSILSALVARLGDRPEEALRYARAWLMFEPHAEAAHAAAVRLLGRLGRIEEALEQYESCRRILGREFGARPTALLESARLRLRGGGAVIEATMPPPRSRRAEAPPLVGREAELSIIEDAMARAVRGESSVLLRGGDSPPLRRMDRGAQPDPGRDDPRLSPE